MYIYYNPNPSNKSVGDCVVRALTILFNDTWDNVYDDLCLQGKAMHDMPDANSVWGEYLKLNGFTCHTIPNICPYCYTIRDFAHDHKFGTYLVATGSHVVAVVDGNYFDTSDSGNEVPIYYWRKEEM